MIIGYVLVSAVAGVLALLVAFSLGVSIWFALGIYALVGSASLVLLSTLQFIVAILADRATDRTTDRREIGDTDLDMLEPSVEHQAAATGPPMKILAVDDDSFVLELIPTIAAQSGYFEVTPARSSEAALKYLQSTDKTFDCLLLDIAMPGMDGIELCRRVRQMPRYRLAPIIMLTAMRNVAYMGEAYRAGATDYATKPFDIENLGTRLRLAQEAIRIQQEADVTKQSGTGPGQNPGHNASFKLSKEIQIEGVESLVSHTILSNYLTQLPQKEIANVQVFAVRLDEIETVYERSSPKKFTSLLRDIAEAATICFGADQTVMAYTSSAVLLIVTSSATASTPQTIEREIEQLLRRNVSEYAGSNDFGIRVSVGGPVGPQAAAAERAKIAMNRAIALAENRRLDKHGRPVAGFSRR